jgi:hypothetical protein
MFTIILGFVPSLILSIYYRVFFLSSVYDIPLIINASVMLGDSILLPYANYYIVKTLTEYNNISEQKFRIGSMILYIMVSLILGLTISIVIHLYWVGDDVTDFVGFRKGVISVPGVWHLAFTAIQLCLSLLFSAVVIKSYFKKYYSVLKISLKPMFVFVIFTLLSIVDTINKKIFVYEETPFRELMKHDSYTFITISFALVLFLIVLDRVKKTN